MFSQYSILRGRNSLAFQVANIFRAVLVLVLMLMLAAIWAQDESRWLPDSSAATTDDAIGSSKIERAGSVKPALAAAADEATLRAGFRGQVEQLLQSAREKQASSGDLQLIRRILLSPRDPQRAYIYVWPAAAELVARNEQLGQSADDSPNPNTAASLGPAFAEHPWSQLESSALAERLNQSCQAHAAELFAVAQESAKEGRLAQAYQLLHEILFLDPNHAESRRILGYRETNGSWSRRTRSLSSRLASGRHALTGWPARTYRQYDSPHYRIATTVEQNQALQVVIELERAYSAWKQLFFDFWANPRIAARWFEGDSFERPPRDRLQVVLCRSREEYLQVLQQMGVEGGEASTGYYNDHRETMFFYLSEPATAGEKPTLENIIQNNIERTTRLQEQAHQLFQETSRSQPGTGEQAHLWAVEGIAMLFETLSDPATTSSSNAPASPCVVFGGIEAQRTQFARLRASRQGLLFPLEKLVAIDRSSFQTDPEVRALYSQSAGLAQFLMFADNGRRREAWLAYLRQIYDGQAQLDSLPTLCGESFAELDAAYKTFLTPNAEGLARMVRPEWRTELALAASRTDDTHIDHICQCRNLRWLQLSLTLITDEAGEKISELQWLGELFVDETRVGDRFVRSVANLPRLAQLDLAGTRITDQALVELRKTETLEALWVSDTSVSDNGLRNLVNLAKLNFIDLRNTRVTAGGVEQFNAARTAAGLPPVEIAR